MFSRSILAAFVFTSATATAAPFSPPVPIRDRASNAIVLFGRMENAKKTPDGEGATDFVITRRLKSHDVLKDRDFVSIPYFIKPAAKGLIGHLVFGSFVDGKLIIHSASAGTAALPDYVAGLLAIDEKDVTKRLRYCFDYLDHADTEVAYDAQLEFSSAPEEVVWKVSKDLPAARIRKRIMDDTTEPNRLLLYASLLGGCGKPEDARLIRTVLDRFTRGDYRPSVYGILNAYTILDPKSGWAFVRELAENPKSDFSLAYSGLRTARHFWNNHPGVIAEKDILEVMAMLLKHDDFADLPIGELRAKKCWKLTEQVLALETQEGDTLPVVRRAILRYALECPNDRSKAFVAELRKSDPERVRKLEQYFKQIAEQK